MDCARVQERLSDYIEGILSNDEKNIFDEHLGSCRQCGAMLSDLRKTIEHLHGLEEHEPPPWLTKTVMSRVREEAERKKSFWHRLFYPVHVKVPLEAIGVVLVALTALYVFQSVQPVLKEDRPDGRSDIPAERVGTSADEPSGSLLQEPQSVPPSEAPEAPAHRSKKGYVKTDTEEIVKTGADVEAGFEEQLRVEAEMKVEEIKKERGEGTIPEPAKQQVQRSKVNERSIIAKQMEGRLRVHEAPVDLQDMEVAEEDSVFESDKEAVLSYGASVAENEEERRDISSPLRASEPLDGRQEGEFITILVDDVEKTLSEIERLTERLSGRIIRRESNGKRVIFTLSLSQDSRKKFLDVINKLGEVSGDMRFTGGEAKGDMIEIVIEKSPTGKE